MAADLEAVRVFTDCEIGADYFSEAEIADIFKRSSANGVMHSLVLSDAQGKIFGVRISFPPGHWSQGKGKGLTPMSWPHAMKETAYFQSIFVAANLHGQNWGGKMSGEAIALLRQSGAKGIVCHSWKESPNNSSFRYLQKLGFDLIAEYPNYWSDVPYDCTRCKKPPCLCTAQEMYLDLKEKKRSQ
jgi:ribosomal protein S18 acetylase RimI-like enzyme